MKVVSEALGFLDRDALPKWRCVCEGGDATSGQQPPPAQRSTAVVKTNRSWSGSSFTTTLSCTFHNISCANDRESWFGQQREE